MRLKFLRTITLDTTICDEEGNAVDVTPVTYSQNEIVEVDEQEFVHYFPQVEVLAGCWEASKSPEEGVVNATLAHGNDIILRLPLDAIESLDGKIEIAE